MPDVGAAESNLVHKKVPPSSFIMLVFCVNSMCKLF